MALVAGEARGITGGALSCVRLAVFLAVALGAGALIPTGALAGIPATPIPQNPSDVEAVPAFVGAPAKARRVRAPAVPQHPFMAPNGRSNLHDDAYQTNTYTWSGPLGSAIQTASAFQGADCASLTVDSAGRLVTV